MFVVMLGFVNFTAMQEANIRINYNKEKLKIKDFLDKSTIQTSQSFYTVSPWGDKDTTLFIERLTSETLQVYKLKDGDKTEKLRNILPVYDPTNGPRSNGLFGVKFRYDNEANKWEVVEPWRVQ